MRQESLKLASLDDYKTTPAMLRKIYSRVQWKPALDMCSNPIGTNSVAPLYFSAMVDALRQGNYIRGKRLMVNPPFKLVE